MVTANELLNDMVDKGASDLHLCVGIPPEMRVDGEMVRTGFDALNPETAETIICSLLSEEQRAVFEKDKEIDFSYSIKGTGRFRINLYQQRGSFAMAARAIPFSVPPMEQLGIPELVRDFAQRQNGLFLVTGPVGSGKSTTLAAMIEHINTSRRARIITVEDPIEYLFRHNMSTISQREVGPDTHSFSDALRRVFRQDPNIILIGEMRDLESIHIALTLAETGHLVLTTLHTSDAVHSISRIVDVFPPYQQQQIKLQLSMVLIGVVSQRLLRRAEGQRGRAVATEVMQVTPSIRNLIRENDLPQIYSAMQTGKKHGMHTMNQSLVELYKNGDISYESALQHSDNQEEFIALTSSL